MLQPISNHWNTHLTHLTQVTGAWWKIGSSTAARATEREEHTHQRLILGLLKSRSHGSHGLFMRWHVKVRGSNTFVVLKQLGQKKIWYGTLKPWCGEITCSFIIIHHSSRITLLNADLLRFSKTMYQQPVWLTVSSPKTYHNKKHPNIWAN